MLLQFINLYNIECVLKPKHSCTAIGNVVAAPEQAGCGHTNGTGRTTARWSITAESAQHPGEDHAQASAHPHQTGGRSVYVSSNLCHCLIAHMGTCLYTRECLCVHICMHAYTHIYTDRHTHTHTHTHTHSMHTLSLCAQFLSLFLFLTPSFLMQHAMYKWRLSKAG